LNPGETRLHTDLPGAGAIVTGITTSPIEAGEMLKEIRRPNGRLILLRQIAFGPGVMTA